MEYNTLLRKLPIGIQTFEKLRKENYLYVDKTALVWRIANTGKPYFLSRPRRFGKSLLLSTFEAYFEGKKELFEGLAIEKMETEWKKFPILHLDLNAKKYETPADLIATKHWKNGKLCTEMKKRIVAPKNALHMS